jgi:hypothetical protein
MCNLSYNAKHMPCTVLSSVACLALQYFSASSHKWHDFWEKVTEHKMCAFIFPTTFVRNIFHCTNNSGTYYSKYESEQHHPVALVNHQQSNPHEHKSRTLHVCLYYFLSYVSVVHSTIIRQKTQVHTSFMYLSTLQWLNGWLKHFIENNNKQMYSVLVLCSCE